MNNANNQKEKQLVGIWNKGEFSVSTQKRHFFKMTDIRIKTSKNGISILLLFTVKRIWSFKELNSI